MNYYQAKEDFVLRKIAGSDVLVPLGKNLVSFNGFFNLNPSAAYIWRCLSEPMTLAQLATKVSSEFGISAQEAETDVSEFLEQLTTQNMVICDERTD